MSQRKSARGSRSTPYQRPSSSNQATTPTTPTFQPVRGPPPAPKKPPTSALDIKSEPESPLGRFHTGPVPSEIEWNLSTEVLQEDAASPEMLGFSSYNDEGMANPFLNTISATRRQQHSGLDRGNLETPPRTVERPLSQESGPSFNASPFSKPASQNANGAISAESIFEYVKKLETENARKGRQIQALTKARDDLRAIIGTMEKEAGQKSQHCEGCRKSVK
ncbi:hypothetical protein HDU86_000555 [Geranomyces michiganensis]|nr:hypothetical protein HDU86_000555 [Geranomyces michiganensis]